MRDDLVPVPDIKFFSIFLFLNCSFKESVLIDRFYFTI